MDITMRSNVDAPQAVADLFAAYQPLHVRYEPDELICQVGSYAAGVYLLTAGIVLESYADPEVRKPDAAIGLLGPGSLIGLELKLPRSEQLHRTTCRAISTVTLTFLERKAFTAAMEEEEPLRSFLIAHLSERHFTMAQALWRARLGVPARLRSLLIDAAPLGELTDAGKVALPQAIDVQRLAALAHTSPRQIRQALAALPGAGWSQERLVFSLDDLRRAPAEQAKDRA